MLKGGIVNGNKNIHSPLNRTARTAPCLQSKHPINFSVSPSADIVAMNSALLSETKILVIYKNNLYSSETLF